VRLAEFQTLIPEVLAVPLELMEQRQRLERLVLLVTLQKVDRAVVVAELSLQHQQQERQAEMEEVTVAVAEVEVAE
jgi:hypothetical protein